MTSLLKQDDDLNQEISDDGSDDPRESIIISDIEINNLDHQQQVLHVGQARRDKSLRTTRDPLPTQWCCTNTVIARPPLPNPRNPAGAMAPPMLKSQKSTLFNRLSDSDHAPSTQALQLHNSSGDQNVSQPKASADQNIPQHQKATLEVAKRLMEAIVFTKAPWPISSNDKYSMVEEASKLAIEAHDR